MVLSQPLLHHKMCTRVFLIGSIMLMANRFGKLLFCKRMPIFWLIEFSSKSPQMRPTAMFQSQCVEVETSETKVKIFLRSYTLREKCCTNFQRQDQLRDVIESESSKPAHLHPAHVKPIVPSKRGAVQGNLSADMPIQLYRPIHAPMQSLQFLAACRSLRRTMF